MRATATTVAMALAAMFGACSQQDDTLRLSWDKDAKGWDTLRIHSSRIPGGKVDTWYLEAFCRRGSTNRAWEETIIPFKTEKLAADPAGRWLKLRTIVDGKVEILHDIRAGEDDVDFRLWIENRSNEAVDVDWAQPCMRVDRFTGRGQDDYFEKCFIFTNKGLTRMHETHRETKARYTPGQTYVPSGIDLNDVNPRPISKTRPTMNLVGCFSADDKWILATAWDQTQELFQGIIGCIHADPRIGGLKPRETKRLHGKVYIVPNDVDALLRRYARDFPEAG